MLPIAIILVSTALALAWLAFRRHRGFGSAENQVERRHPATHFEEQDPMALKRRDDSVGGEQ